MRLQLVLVQYRTANPRCKQPVAVLKKLRTTHMHARTCSHARGRPQPARQQSDKLWWARPVKASARQRKAHRGARRVGEMEKEKEQAGRLAAGRLASDPFTSNSNTIAALRLAPRLASRREGRALGFSGLFRKAKRGGIWGGEGQRCAVLCCGA